MDANNYTCEYCGGTYPPRLKLDGTPRKRRTNYCSRSCLRKAWRRDTGRTFDERCVTLLCKCCGNEYKPIRKDHRSFCGTECKKYWFTHSHKYMAGPIQPRQVVSRVVREECAALSRVARRVAVRPTTATVAWRQSYESRKNIECADCHKVFKQERRKGPVAERCSSCSIKYQAREKRRARRAGRDEGRVPRDSDRKRARRYGVEYEPVKPLAVFERDGWKCQICGKRTPQERRGSIRSNAPEIDHRVPISKGGPHTYSNVQCACRACNGSKGNTTYAGQMPLLPIQ